MKYAFGCFAGALFAVGSAVPVSADRLFSQQDGVSAYLSDDFTCSERVRLTLDGETRDIFQSGRDRLGRIVGGVRAALGFRCDGIKDILIRGTVEGETVFAAVVSENTSWSLFEVPLEMVASGDQKDSAAVDVQPPAAESQSDQSPVAAPLPPVIVEQDDNNGFAATVPTVPPAIAGAPSTGESSAGIEQFRALKENVETGSFPIDGYKFPGLMTALYLGRMNDIPDDQNIRSLVGSVLRAFAENCAEPPMRVAAMLPGYISPKMRSIQRDPGRGFAEMLMGLARMRDQALDTGNFGGAMADFAEEYAAYSSEGIADGRVFIARHGCPSPEHDQISSTLHSIVLRYANTEPGPSDRLILARLMSHEYRAQNNIADPEVELQRRKLEASQADTRTSCDAQFDSSVFCSCAIEKLKIADVSEEIWQTMSGSFLNVTKFPQLRSVMTQCY